MDSVEEQSSIPDIQPLEKPKRGKKTDGVHVMTDNRKAALEKARNSRKQKLVDRANNKKKLAGLMSEMRGTLAKMHLFQSRQKEQPTQFKPKPPMELPQEIKPTDVAEEPQQEFGFKKLMGGQGLIFR